MPESIRDWQRHCGEQAIKSGWYDCPVCQGSGQISPGSLVFPHDCFSCNGSGRVSRNIPEVLMLMVSELSEALEHYREGNEGCPLNVVYREGAKPDGFAVELADCVIRILDTCHNLGIDLQATMEAKTAYNASRPRRHGGKRC